MNIDNLIVIILYEVGITLILAILALLLIILWLLKKTVVTVTVVSVEAEAASYDHGDTVNISGKVTEDGQPKAGASVNLKVTDLAGTEYALPDATTDTDGKFTAAWVIPSEVSPGACTIAATSLGSTATATFTFGIKKPLSLLKRK